MDVDVARVEVCHVTLFMEFLCQNGFAVSAIRNYLAGITMFLNGLA